MPAPRPERHRNKSRPPRGARGASRYGGADPAAVIDEIADRLRRARENHSTAGRDEATAIFDGLLAWIQRTEGR